MRDSRVWKFAGLVLVVGALFFVLGYVVVINSIG